MARRARLEVGLEEVTQVIRRELARVEVVVDHLPWLKLGLERKRL